MSTMAPSLSPQKIALSPKVRDVKISPDGIHILYQVQPFYKASDRTVSALWIAKTNEAESAKALTNGLHNDKAGVFHPDGRRVIFLSDRHNPGKGSHIYVLWLGNAEANDLEEPQSLTSAFGTKGVQGFDISPDGNFIAFTSADEPTDEDMKKIREKNDAKVVGEKTGFSCLRVYSFSTGEVSTLRGIRRDWQIESATWSPDSKEILYRMRQNRGSEYAEQDIVLERVAIDNDAQRPDILGYYPRSPSGQSMWLSSGHIASLQSYDAQNTLDARTLHIHPAGPLESVMDAKNRHKLYGLTEDAVGLVNMRSTTKDLEGRGMLAVEVCSDVDTHIDVLSFAREEEGGGEFKFTLFQTDCDAIWFGAWDAKRVVKDNGEISYVFAAVLSSGIRHEPPNVWSGRVQGERGGIITSKIKLSSHHQWLADAPRLNVEVLHWKASDGTQLSGLARYPPGYQSSWGPLPTVLFMHGGPYRRDIPDYMPYFCNWRELFASAGYLVISPNYRGGQGRGHNFAHAASRGIGKHDWPDCESMVDEAIHRGIADPSRLGVAGWSHGGSLTAWGVTKTKNRFKAAIVGAGVTNWEGMVMESGSPELEIQIGQSSPWDEDEGDHSLRKKSPIHSVSGVSTAILIMHGERDERVPVGQAIGFWRGLKRKASTRGKEGAQLVIYPREPHGFVEQKHAEDVLCRAVAHFATWI